MSRDTLRHWARRAASKAINDAKKSVAEKNRDGSIGEANAMRDQRVQVSSADATAVEGENRAKITHCQLQLYPS